jgi:hypothetical protein
MAEAQMTDRGSTRRGDERAFDVLLEELTRDRLSTEAVERELDATARRSPADIQEAQEHAAREEMAWARSERATFEEALRDARARSGPRGEDDARYDSADPRQNALADALIQLLVRTDFASVRTETVRAETPGAERYLYYIRVDWPRLRQISEQAGHTLPL